MGVTDWMVVALYLSVLAAIIAASRKRVRNVTDYLVAGRFAGKYLLAGSSGMMWLGLAVAAAEFEKFYQAGFSAVWWTLLFAPLGYILAAFGWINYRFRATEAMTMGQFFEMRYSRRFRICAAAMMLFAGLLNYGIFPGVSAEIIVAVAGLPRHFPAFGFEVPTVSAVVVVLVAVALSIALFGGFIAILIAGFIQSQLFYLTLLCAAAVVIARLGWHPWINSALAIAPLHRLNPFQPEGIKGFDSWFFVLLALRNVYNYENWPSGQGFMAAAKTPHESKMAGILGEWRNNLQMFTLMALAFSAFALLHLPAGKSLAESLGARLSTDLDEQSRLVVPVAIGSVLPAGLLGLFCSVLVGASLARDNTDLLTWGGIFIQDVVLPLRRRPFRHQQHLACLRFSVLGVSLFVVLWSWFFPLRQYIWLYLNLCSSVYLGGSGIVIIGGLYWRRATVAGAWAAMLTGGFVALIGLVLQIIWSHSKWLLRFYPAFPLDGMWVALWASIAAIVAYVLISLLTPARIISPSIPIPSANEPDASSRYARLRAAWRSLKGPDRAIYAGQLAWSFGIGALCLFMTGWNFFVMPLHMHFWRLWWAALTIGLGIISAITLAWLLVGGTRDVFYLMRNLKTVRNDDEGPGSRPS